MKDLGLYLAKIVGALIVLALLVLLATESRAATSASDAQVRIPSASVRYRLHVEREASLQWGLGAPVARIAAQLHQESAWRADAQSPYAQGLAQFTPATAAWLPGICPEVGEPDPWDAGWSIRAAVCYDAYLHAAVRGADECERWAMTLSAYNGGLGWVRRDVALAAARGADPLRWFDHVELHTARAKWARIENRDYPRRILRVLEPAYIAAGWSGEAACP